MLIPVKKSVSFAFMFVVIVPLVVVSWLGWRSIGAEQERFKSREFELQQRRLQEISENQSRWLVDVESELVRLLDELAGEPIMAWPEIQKRNRFADQVFMIDADGMLKWPDPSVQVLTDHENKFRESFELGRIPFKKISAEDGSVSGSYHWATWFDGPGQQWAYWFEDPEERIVGVVMDRISFIAEAIAQLPDKIPSSRYETPSETFALVDEYGVPLYTWGGKFIPDQAGLSQEIPMPAPLNAWHIRLMPLESPTSAWYNQPLVLTMVLSILMLSIFTLGAAYYFYSETRREFEDARQRVSFVNQVSHELKTPLTNIQLYSELLEDALTNGDGNRHLTTIKAESAKLARMIQNVLSFARNQRAALQLHPRDLVPDVCLQEVIESHRHGLHRKDLSLTLDLQAVNSMNIDSQVLEQIIGNLLSNAEKYAPGSTVVINSRQDEDMLVVSVEDDGPGIVSSRKEEIFKPFVRLENKATEGVSGTGIGLSIARDLARIHGGDLKLVPSEKGARFLLELKEIG